MDAKFDAEAAIADYVRRLSSKRWGCKRRHLNWVTYLLIYSPSHGEVNKWSCVTQRTSVNLGRVPRYNANKSADYTHFHYVIPLQML